MDMNFKYTLTSEGATFTKTVTETADTGEIITLSIPTATNQQVLVAFTVAALKGFAIKSDKAITLRTNANDGTADDIFVIAVDSAFLWHSKSLLPTPFSQDVTTLYIQNASGATAAIDLRVLRDATP
jgi:hypothetical protein